MSKIQFNELNTTSLEVLNQEETTAVVGGVFNTFAFSFNDNSVRTNVAIFEAANLSAVNQFGIGNGAGVGQGINIGFSQS